VPQRQITSAQITVAAKCKIIEVSVLDDVMHVAECGQGEIKESAGHTCE
jgi:hypothetical protein